MASFVVQTARVNGNYANALYKYDTLDEAKKSFHSFMSYQIMAENVDYAMCAIVDRNGNTIQREVWDVVSDEPVEA